MKRYIYNLIFVFIIIALCFCGCTNFKNNNGNNEHVINPPKAEKFEGKGTKEEPYLIENLNNLIYLSELVNYQGNTYVGNFFALTNDIDIKNYDWMPIGGEFAWGNYDFMGYFDGGGHTILNLTITNFIWSHKSGFFGSCVNSEIKNLNIAKGKIDFKTGHRVVDAGLLIGYSKSTNVVNCKVEGSINISSDLAEQSLGGIIGSADTQNGLRDGTKLKNCESEIVIVSDSAVPYLGGIIGRCGCIKIIECQSTSQIIYNFANSYYAGDIHIGGLLGSHEGVQVNNCIVNTNINADTNKITASGLIGYADWSEISNCKVNGLIKVSNSSSLQGYFHLNPFVGRSRNYTITDDCLDNIKIDYDNGLLID